MLKWDYEHICYIIHKKKQNDIFKRSIILNLYYNSSSELNSSNFTPSRLLIIPDWYIYLIDHVIFLKPSVCSFLFLAGENAYLQTGY